MKNTIYIIGLIILIAIIYIFYWRRIEFTFIKKVALDSNEIRHDFDIAIFNNIQELESCIELPPLKEYNKKHLIEICDFNFEKDDYIFSFGRELKEIKYNWYYALFVDEYYSLFKRNNKRIPVKAEYKNGEIKNEIYIYSLKKKNKYRGIL